MKSPKVLKNFYCIEGANGSGKTTIIQKIKEKYQPKNIIFTKEPSDGVIGTIIRNQLSQYIDNIPSVAFEYLFTADRIDHLHNKTQGILKWLINGYKVFSDRYLFSSLVYRGDQFATLLNKNFPLPEIVFYITKYNKHFLIQRQFKISDRLAKAKNPSEINAKYKQIMNQYKKYTQVTELTNYTYSDLKKNIYFIWNILNR